ncbi:MAG TPA: hypothetical protein VFH27_15325, partial [Longimicrobiaceae bacterium]|nr:hypothetical protein [Longimicrobiaceae bacterium]
MNSKIGGAVLLAVAAFMLLGFARTGASLSSATALAALLVTVALPAGFGVVLLRGGPRDRTRELRRQTIDAEILKLAMAQQGRLTEVEVASML